MQQKQQNGFLFGLLLSVSFLIVVVLWLPTVKGSFVGIISDIGSKTKDTTLNVEGQWRDAQDAVQKILPKSPSLGSLQGTRSPEISKDVVDTLKEVISAGTATSSDSTQVSPVAVASSEKKFCTRQGGVYQMRSESALSLAYGVCVFPNGSECSASMFEYNKCHIGQFAKAEDGIPRKADLVITVVKTEVRVVNQGWASSFDTFITEGARRIPVPGLKPGASFLVTGATQSTDHVVDPNDTIKEIIEENNSYHAPQA
ncbi:MAG: DUF333 domain-containing protein [bacterium]|nr:DUF333 domain-containing protein [bacterium]